MKYDHLVKACGEFYWPGEEVPEDTGTFQENREKDKDSEKNTQDENLAEGIFKEWQLKA